jgi:phage terminase large subunit GpA-like protein
MSRLPTETQRAVVDAALAGLAPLRSVPPMTLSDWAAEHFRLSAESSHTQGRWQAYPFQRAWMDAFSNDDIEEVTVRKSKRVGYTKTLLAFIAYNAAHRRRKQAVWQPTDDDRDSFVKAEVDPMLRDVTAMAPVLRSAKEDTLKLKTFLGSVLHTLGGKAARAYRRITVAVAMLDEASAFDLMIERSVDPIEGARGRLEGAPFPKLIAGSTPRLKGMDHIERRELAADAMLRYHITCPHCQVEQPLMWGGESVAHGFKWDKRDPASVRHLCPHCRGAITQADYLRLYTAGTWVSVCGDYRYGQDSTWRNATGAPRRAPRHVAFHIWTAYSPQRSWPDIVREFLEATDSAREGEKGPLITFVNETLGDLWEEVFERADEHELAKRAEPYNLRTVPRGGLVLVAGVDVQERRFEVVVWAIGAGEEMWAVDYAVLNGNPADERDWAAKLDPYLGGVFTHASGRSMRIEAVAIDTGGHYTHQAYNYCRHREQRKVYAVRGDPLPSKKVKGRATVQDVNWRGQILKRGVRLWYVGTDTAKDLIYGRLQVLEPGPGYVHFSQFLPPEFYHQLTAESRVPVRTARGLQFRWTNTKNRRNEVLDCTVYAIFAAHAIGLDIYTRAMWQRLRDAIDPGTGDLFGPEPVQSSDAAHAVPQLATAKPQPARPAQPTDPARAGFGRRW